MYENVPQTDIEEISGEFPLRQGVDKLRKKIKEAFSPEHKQWHQALEVVEKINQLEIYYQSLSAEQLRETSATLKERLRDCSLDEILPEAFAAVREASRRTLGLRHFDVQLAGGYLLHKRQVVQMQTGEGKTLVATLPLFLNALEGKGAHLVTTNDYLAKSATQWMGPVYQALGLNVAAIQAGNGKPDQSSYVYDPDYPSPDDSYRHLRPVSRCEAYQADITYGTNNEFGFDYLRDNMVGDLSDCVQRELHYALVDEADSVLIDGSRSPLIISGSEKESSDLFFRFAEIVDKLHPEKHYTLNQHLQLVALTDDGVDELERLLNISKGESLYDDKHSHMLAYLDNALRAKEFYTRDKQYSLVDGGIVIIDEDTGRLVFGRRYSNGLHQAIEAKEQLEIRPISITYATITFQNFFRMYHKLAGMTGTAATAREEFRRIYGLDVAVLPTNVEHLASCGKLKRRAVEVQELRGMFAELFQKDDGVAGHKKPPQVTTYREDDQKRFFERLDLLDQVYLSGEAKIKAVLTEIKAVYEKNRPVLVGTTSVKDSESLSSRLRNLGIPHRVLNARYHEQEAAIIAQAGRSGAVTIATNMAGRGVDIMLGGNPEALALERIRKEGIDPNNISRTDWEQAVKQIQNGENPTAENSESWVRIMVEVFKGCSIDQRRVRELGGLHVIGTQRHEARRIDNQLRGRAGRQGDPGSSRFFVALDDLLMTRFGGQRHSRGTEDDGEAILYSPLVARLIKEIQQRAENFYFDIRKYMLSYDDVINRQREVIYNQRRVLLSHDNLPLELEKIIKQEIQRVVIAHTTGIKKETWKLNEMLSELRFFLPSHVLSYFDDKILGEMSPDKMVQQLQARAIEVYSSASEAEDNNIFSVLSAQKISLRILEKSNILVQKMIVIRAFETFGADKYEELAGKSWDSLSEQEQIELRAVLVEACQHYSARQLMLKILDGCWVRHLTRIDELREGIGLQAIGQQEPLFAYQKEAYEMYQEMIKFIRIEIVKQALTK